MNPFTNAICHGSTDTADYHKQDFKRGDPRFVMSRSELVNFASNPNRWIHGYKLDDDGTDATEWGSLLDCLVTEPARFGEKFAVKPETYRNEKGDVKPWSGNANVCKAWAEEQGERIIIKLDDRQQADYAVSRLHKDPEIYEFISCSEKQVMATADYVDKATGVVVPCKILVDFVPDANHPKLGKELGDLKTARNAAPDKNWNDEVFRRHYHWQAAMNLDIYNAAVPADDRQGFRHVISENVHPYEPGRRWLEQEKIQLGRAGYLAALALYADCLANKRWPGWDDNEGGLIPKWSPVRVEAYMVKI